MAMIELETCPFCGSKPRIRSCYAPDHGTELFVIECFRSPTVCGVRPVTKWCKSAEAAAEAWNRRATDEEMLKRIARILTKSDWEGMASDA